MSWPSKRTWPRVGLQEAGEDFYGGTFPRAIGAQVSKHLARLKTKCDFSNSRDGTIELCESNRFEHGHPLDEQADKLPPWLETISFDTVRTDKVSVGRGRVHRLHPGFLTKSAESLEKNRVAFLTSATDLQISAKKSAHVLQENGVNLRDRVRFSKKSLARQDLEGVSTPPEIRLTPINWIRSIWKRLVDLLVGDSAVPLKVE